MSNEEKDRKLEMDRNLQRDANEAGTPKAAVARHESAHESADATAREVPLPPEAHGRIAAQLREVYGQMLAEPMPDKFAQLLEKLAKPHASSHDTSEDR